MIDEKFSDKRMTKKEQEDYDALRFGFNINKEINNFDYVAARRVEIARPWAKRLLTYSFYINCVSIACILIALVMILIKPPPKYYAATPSGKVIPLQSTNRL